MVNDQQSNTTRSLLLQIAKYAGFSSKIDLFNGKMGIAILLYHGSRCFCSTEMEIFADALIDDIIEEMDQLNTQSCIDRSWEIAWGFNHLMTNKFIDVDTNFFDAFDNPPLHEETFTHIIQVTKFPFYGLYILSRYETSHDKSLWINKANSYCDQIFNLLDTYPRLFFKDPNILTPYWYCLLKWREYNFPFIYRSESIEKVCHIFEKVSKNPPIEVKSSFTKHFINRFLGRAQIYQFPEIKVIGDVNTVYLNKFLYRDIAIPSQELLDNVINPFINEEQLLNGLIKISNHHNIGLSGYISGLALSLLQHKYHIKIK